MTGSYAIYQGTAAQGWGSSAPAAVVSAVQTASARTGVDFSYLMQKASVESGYNTNAKAATSSATGLYQFTDSTWLDMMAQHGEELGMGQYADAISYRANGTPYVADPAMRDKILALRKDPTTSAMMAAELAQDNKATLQQAVGGRIGKTELYLAHFLGAGGASKFLNAMKSNPSQSGASLLPEAAAANTGAFYDANGKALSLSQIYDKFAQRFSAGGTASSLAATAVAVQEPDTSSQPWLSGLGSAGGKPALSNYTILMLNALDAPEEGAMKGDTGDDQQTGASKDKNTVKREQDKRKVAPNLLAASQTAA